VLLFFGALFIVVAGLEKSHVPGALFTAVSPHLPRSGVASVLGLSGTLLVGCQVISNVPFILITKPLVDAIADPRLAWMVVALVSTLAGNLTLLGSVANVIVIEAAQAEKEMGFRAYLKIGAPVTLVSTLLALAVLAVTR
jgi:Na+/H+ antiporter NhaD/arsenite permease-like protein